MVKVLLINPVVRQEDVPKHIPYGIAQLAAIVDQAGHKVQIFDANAWRRRRGSFDQHASRHDGPHP